MPVYAQSDGCARSGATCDVIIPLCASRTEDMGTVQTQVANTDDGPVLEMRYDLDEGYERDETHPYVGKTRPEKLASNPGQFPFSSTYMPGVSGDRYLIDFDETCAYEVTGGRSGNGRGRGRGRKRASTKTTEAADRRRERSPRHTARESHPVGVRCV
jgi:hypothetical protein